MSFSKDSIWVEKYRPPNIEQCILPQHIKNNLEQFVIHKNIPNIMIHSIVGGSGKTTVVRALANQLDYETLFINASEQRGIDVLRNDITQFVSTVSIDGRNKCVIFDEFDNCTLITQSALRNFIEQFSNVRFFFTCNYLDRVIQPLQSRCTVLSFDWPQESIKPLKNLFYKRVIYILQQEKVSYKKEVIVEIIQRFFPDFRRIINELQRYSITGIIDEGLLSFSKEIELDSLILKIKNKNFTEVRCWVEEANVCNYEMFFNKLYEKLKEVLVPTSLPPCILVLASYQYKHAFVLDKQINILALLIEIMQEAKFK